MKNYNLSAEWLENTRKETFSRNYFLKDGNAYYCHSLTMLRVLQTSLSEKEKQSEHQPKLGDAVLTADEYYEILDIYATAYNAGRVMFREKYLIDKNVLYGINADSYIRQLDKNLNDIWIPESRNNSIVVSEAVIVKMGTAAGHWHELTDIYNDHKELFEKYEIKAIDEAPEAEAPEADNKKSFADYLTCDDKNKNKLIEKIRKADRNTPKSIYIILKALFDNGILTMNNKETIYKAYHAEFGYHKDYETLKRGLNYYDIDKSDTKNQQKIGNMYEHLTS